MLPLFTLQSRHEHEMTILQNVGERTILKHTLDGINESYNYRNEIKRNRRNPTHASLDPLKAAEKSNDLFGITVTDDDILTDDNGDDSEGDDKNPSAVEEVNYSLGNTTKRSDGDEARFIFDSVKKTVSGKGARMSKPDRDIEAIRIQPKGKAADGWVLSNGINVGELFTEYRRAAKDTDM